MPSEGTLEERQVTHGVRWRTRGGVGKVAVG